MAEERFVQVCIEHQRVLEPPDRGDGVVCPYPGHGAFDVVEAFAVFDKQKQRAVSLSTLLDGERFELNEPLATLTGRWAHSTERVELLATATTWRAKHARGMNQRTKEAQMGKPIETRKHEVKKLEKKGHVLFVRLVLAKAKSAGWRVTWTKTSAKGKRSTGISFKHDDEAPARTAYADSVAALKRNGWTDSHYGRGVKITPIPMDAE